MPRLKGLKSLPAVVPARFEGFEMFEGFEASKGFIFTYVLVDDLCDDRPLFVGM